MPHTDPQPPWSPPSGPPSAAQPERRGAAGTGRASGSAPSPSRRWATVGGLGAGLIGGVTAGLVLGVPGLSGATDAPSLDNAVPAQTEEQTPADEGASDGPDAPTPGTERAVADDERLVDAADRIRENLQELVDDGTLDAEQAAAVAEHLASQRPSGALGRGHGHGPTGREIVVFDGERGDRISERLEARTGRMDELADALGLQRDDLVDRLLDGETLADVAEAQGIDADVLVDVLIAERVERIDQALADGEIDPDEAAERTAALEEMAAAHLAGDHPASPRGHWEPRPDLDESVDDRADDQPADDSAD